MNNEKQFAKVTAKIISFPVNLTKGSKTDLA